MKLEDKSSVDDKNYVISLLVYVPGEYKKNNCDCKQIYTNYI